MTKAPNDTGIALHVRTTSVHPLHLLTTATPRPPR
jgi:hypothetical protein